MRRPLPPRALPPRAPPHPRVPVGKSGRHAEHLHAEQGVSRAQPRVPWVRDKGGHSDRPGT